MHPGAGPLPLTRPHLAAPLSVLALLVVPLWFAAPGFAAPGFAAPVLAAPGSDGAEAWRPRPELLVSGAWLAAHQQGEGLRIMDVRDAQAYAAGHIPGAVNLPPEALFAAVNGVDGMLPPLDTIAATLGQAGIGDDTTVVAYDAASGLYAARLFWVLDYLGQARGRLLDGGWPLWQEQGRPTSPEPVQPAPRQFIPRPQPERIADLAWMRAHLEDPHTVTVDARSTWEYRGITRYAKHRGHIPGAVSMEWKRHLRGDGTLRPPAELRAEYEGLGVTPAREVAVYCQIHVRASHSYFTLRWLGHPRVRGYDGSWEEWGNRDDTPKALF